MGLDPKVRAGYVYCVCASAHVSVWVYAQVYVYVYAHVSVMLKAQQLLCTLGPNQISKTEFWV